MIDKTLTKPEAEFEIYADAIANELFTDYKAIEVLATQNQSLFTRLKQWFYRNVIKTSEQTTVLGTKAAQRKTYALMLKAEKAAMNKASSEGVAFSAKKKYNKKTTYKEYDSNVMQWSNSASTFEGDTKFFSKSADDFRLLKADERGGYIEMAKGSYSEMRDLDERTYAESSQDFNRYAQERRNEQGRYNSNNEFYENRKNDELINGQTGRDVSEYNTETSYADSLQDNTRGKLVYSAMPSETAQRITENFGYTDTTANNIVKAARTLRQKAKLI